MGGNGWARVALAIEDEQLRGEVERVARDAGADVLPAMAGGLPDPAAGLVVADRDPGTRSVPLVLVTRGSDSVWAEAARCDAERVVVLPAGGPWLRQRIGELGHGAGGRHLAVVGARGGCGATTLAVGLGRALLAHGVTVVVDGDDAGPGIDLALGREAAEGLRWPDLHHIRGPVPAQALSGRLPEADGLDILAGPPGLPLDACWRPVLSSLRGSHEYVVSDVPRFALPRAAGAAATVVVTSLDLVGLTAAGAVLEGLSGTVIVAVRRQGGPMTMSAVSRHLGAVTAVEVPSVRRITGAADFGDLAQAVSGNGFAKACRRVLEVVG